MVAPVLADRINNRISAAVKILKNLKYEPVPISPEEFHDYLTGETLTGDKITIDEILGKDYFMVHELVEICELKRNKILITKRTMLDFPFAVYSAHIQATEMEFNYALVQTDYDWLRKRLQHASGWFEDPFLPDELRPRYEQLVKKYQQLIKNI